MKTKWIFKLSLALNILVITVLLIVGMKYLGYYRSSQSSRASSDQVLPDFQWPEGKKMALSFTFDDAYLSQIDSGVPIFNKYGIKATFYVSIWRLAERQDAWKKAITDGHEIGNHTYRHPCTVNHDFIEDNSLEYYTISRMNMELHSANEFIKEMLGIYPVSFAYPCGETFIGKGLNTKSYVPLVSAMFESGRGYTGGLTNPVSCDMAQLQAEKLDGKSFNEIKELIEKAKNTGKWLILAGHEISEVDNQASSKSTIEDICEHATDASNGIWIDNVHNIASYVREKRGDGPFVKMSGYEKPVHSVFSKLWSKYYVFKFKSGSHKNGSN